jgi:hypothetical protein
LWNEKVAASTVFGFNDENCGYCHGAGVPAVGRGVAGSTVSWALVAWIDLQHGVDVAMYRFVHERTFFRQNACSAPWVRPKARHDLSHEGPPRLRMTLFR